jgi:hypothetical protein
MSIKYRKSEFIVITIASWVFAIICYFLIHFTIGSIFFLIAALYNSYLLFSKHTNIKLLSNKAYKKEMSSTIEERKADTGIFDYYDTGFIANFENNSTTIEWSSIKALFSYKADLYTVDEICLDIFYENTKQVRLTEDTHGWNIFLGKLRIQFPQIKMHWAMEIAFPAFETNLTLLYEFENKSLEESIKFYYTIK